MAGDPNNPGFIGTAEQRWAAAESINDVTEQEVAAGNERNGPLFLVFSLIEKITTASQDPKLKAKLEKAFAEWVASHPEGYPQAPSNI